MTKRALLFGSQTYGLTGANADVHLMAETLEARGFEVRVHVDDDATRTAMVAAYEQLIADTPDGSDDPVVVYYSGHGGRTALEQWQELQHQGKRSHLRYLVPFDMDASTETDFRGLLSEELSALQRRLTTRTRNVTTILDCCHSGTMSRDASLLPKAVAREFSIMAALPLLEAIDLDAGPATSLDDSNPHAVRLVACDPRQSAYERASSLGGRHGALTEQLAIALRELGDRSISWRVLGDRIRRNVTATLPMQRPEVEGPADRLLFSLATRSAVGALPVTVEGGVARIDAARLFGLSVGDEYRLQTDDEQALGAATVESIDGDRAMLAVTGGPGSAPLPASAVALPVRTTRTKAVRLAVGPGLLVELTGRVAASGVLRVAGANDVVAAAIVEQDGLLVQDTEGYTVQQSPFATDADGMARAVALAERIATAERLRALASEADDDILAGALRVELARHDGARRSVLRRSGERLYPGEQISVTIGNDGTKTLYVGLFDIDTSYAVTQLNKDEPSGWRLEPGDDKHVPASGGVALEWDAGVPDDAERPETLLVVGATTPQAFGLLETPKGAVGGSELENRLLEVGTGTRGFRPPTDKPVSSYRAEAIDFYLVPGRKPDVDEPAFAINDLPELAQRVLRPKTMVQPPSRLGVRLVSLTVRNNKALFKAAVRVDALVITGGEQQVTATPFTHRFPGVADGDLLPADNLLLYLGDVRDFLDIALWVSRDDAKGADLAALFETEVADPKTRGALTVVAGLVLAVPQAAAAVGAVAAVATVVRVGAGLIDKAVGKDIGLYRTSFLPFERFGLGRQPKEGLRQAQGIEFAYEVVDPG